MKASGSHTKSARLASSASAGSQHYDAAGLRVKLQQEKKQFSRKVASFNKLNKSRAEFITSISHELRVPIAVAKESLSHILHGINDPLKESQRRILDRAQTQLDHIANITDALLDLYRMERGTFKLRYSLVNLNDLVKDLIESYHALSVDKGIRLTYALPAQQINIFIDPDRIDQVLSNLLDNAVKFTDKGGSIRVRVELLENKVRFGVLDTGGGIDPLDLERIFDKGVQLRGKKGAKNRGIGLGLAISRELVDRHGGEIWAESSVGQGSAFYFTLPRFYTANLLDQRTRLRINNLLEQDVAVHLINLLIVNYREFRKLVRKEGGTVSERLRNIIVTAVREFQRQHKREYEIFLSDFHDGECTIIVPEAGEQDVGRFCGQLRERISRFLSAYKVENSFINIGVLEFMYKTRQFKAGVAPVSIYVKKIFIGAEKRQDKRHAYQMPVEPIALDGTLGGSYTLDISKRGLCFLAPRQLKTDARITIKLLIAKPKRTLVLRGRVAWIKEIPGAGSQAAKFQTGMEFIGMNDEDSFVLSRFLRSIAHKDARSTGAR